MPSSQAVESHIREKAAKLETFCQRILSCRVTIEAPHRHHHKGKAYGVRIDIVVPGDEIVINHVPNRLRALKLTERGGVNDDFVESHQIHRHGAHEDVYVAIRDAFNAAGRKLQDYVRRRSGVIKTHEFTSELPSEE
jgi:ribosome-associated translation inhibitor RaiA